MSHDAPLPPFNASDPTATFVSTSCLGLLLIELVPLTYRLARTIDINSPSHLPHAQSTSAPTSSKQPDTSDSTSITATTTSNPKPSTQPPATNTTSTSNTLSKPSTLPDEELNNLVFHRLDALGYRVGQGLVERFAKDRPRFDGTLDCIKFLCKDLWMLLFRKQIDNLKTNHRGVYVLTDNSFRPFTRMSTAPGGDAITRAQPYLWFPCGIVRGALSAMGVQASVMAESGELPGATFQIKAGK